MVQLGNEGKRKLKEYLSILVFFMMKSIGIALTLTSLVTCVAADCMTEIGCSDPVSNRSYRLGQRWKPEWDTCYSCKCIEAKKTVLSCKVAVDDNPDPTNPKLSVKKSQVSARLESVISYAEDEQVQVTEKEAGTLACPPTRSPRFNLATRTFEHITYKTVAYYYFRKESRCCNQNMAISFLHPSCKVVEVGKCRSKVVKKSNPRLRCNMPMSMVG